MRTRLVLVLALAVLGVCATSASATDHRTPGSPCHGDGKSVNDEGANGVVHCSAIYRMPPSNEATRRVVYRFPEADRPADCAEGTRIKGTGGSAPVDFWGPHWFFAPAHGQWVTWEPELYSFILRLAPGWAGAVNITPRFWNHHPNEDWPTRYYFYCTPLKPPAPRPDPTPGAPPTAG